MTVANICAQFQPLFRIRADSAGLASHVALRQNCYKQVTSEPGVRLTMERRLEQTGAGRDIDSEIHGRAQHCLIFVSILFFLATCVTGPFDATGAGFANFVYTEKLPTNHIANRVLSKNYNLLKLIEDDGPMCRNSFKRENIKKPHCCYLTIL